jgi:predicted DsbA family dithiol-disulfide isomerase
MVLSKNIIKFDQVASLRIQWAPLMKKVRKKPRVGITPIAELARNYGQIMHHLVLKIRTSGIILSTK